MPSTTTTPRSPAATSKPQQSGAAPAAGNSNPVSQQPGQENPAINPQQPVTQQHTPGQTNDNNNSVLGITIVDQQNEPIKDAEVSILGQKIKTDENGTVSFSNIPSGKLKLSVNYKGKETEQTVNVKGNSSVAAPQLLTVSLKRSKPNPLLLLVLPLVIIFLIPGGLFARPWIKQHVAATHHTNNDPVLSPQPEKIETDDGGHTYANAPPPGSTFSPDTSGPGPTTPPQADNKPSNPDSDGTV